MIYAYDTTTIRLRRIARACFHSTRFDASKKWTCQFFRRSLVVVVSQSNRTQIVISITSVVVECVVVSSYRSCIIVESQLWYRLIDLLIYLRQTVDHIVIVLHDRFWVCWLRTSSSLSSSLIRVPGQHLLTRSTQPCCTRHPIFDIKSWRLKSDETWFTSFWCILIFVVTCMGHQIAIWRFINTGCPNKSHLIPSSQYQ